MIFLSQVFALFKRIKFFYSDRGVIEIFIRYSDDVIQLFKTRQRLHLKFFLVFGGGNVAVGHENGVAGVIVRAIKIFQFLIAEVRNILRLTTAVVVIGGRGVELFA